MIKKTFRPKLACVVLALTVAPVAIAQTTAKVEQVSPAAAGDIPKTFTPVQNGFDSSSAT